MIAPLLQKVEADERTAELVEGVVDVVAPLVADDQPAHLVQPGDGSLDDPAVPAQPLGGLDPRPGDAALDPPAAEHALVSSRAVALVGVQLLGPPARPPTLATHGRNRIDQPLQHRGLVDVGRRGQLRERDALAVRDQVPLRPRLAAIRRVRAGLVTPFFAGTVEASMAARDQSI